MIVVLFFVSLLTFLLFFLGGSNPAKAITGTHATPQVLARINEYYGFDKPLWTQYGLYLWHLVHGNTGTGYQTQQAVATAILQRFPATAMVALSGIFFELAIGIPVGMMADRPTGQFRHRGRLVEKAVCGPPTGQGGQVAFHSAAAIRSR